MSCAGERAAVTAARCATRCCARRRSRSMSCNCSICAMTGYLHLIVDKPHFRLLKGEENLTLYTFNTRTAKHLFCKTCGVKSFYFPRSHPDGVSVNYRCLDGAPIGAAHITPFDGQNWEESARGLSAHNIQDGTLTLEHEYSHARPFAHHGGGHACQVARQRGPGDQGRRRDRRDRDRQGDDGGRGGRRGHARQDPHPGRHRRGEGQHAHRRHRHGGRGR